MEEAMAALKARNSANKLRQQMVEHLGKQVPKLLGSENFKAWRIQLTMAEAENSMETSIMDLEMTNADPWALNPQETLQDKFDRLVMYNVIRNTLPESKLRWLADEQGASAIVNGDARGLYKKVHKYVNRITADSLNRLHNKFCHELSMKTANCDLDSWQVVVSNKAQELDDKGRAVDEAQQVQVYLDGLTDSYARIREELLTKPPNELTWEYVTTRVADFHSSMNFEKLDKNTNNSQPNVTEDQFNTMYRMFLNKNNNNRRNDNNNRHHNNNNRNNNNSGKFDKICRFFAKGHCKNGDDCHFKHDKSSQEECFFN
jgi:hypothetical protein